MNMKQIECFIALAETLNFTKASELCYVSQSAFSRLISSLEDELGCKLIARSKVNPRLTNAGERIYEQAKLIQFHGTEMKNIATIANNGELGDFRIGILEKGLTKYCVNLILEYQEKCPNMSFDFQEYGETDLVKAIEHQQVDFGILPFFPEMLQEKMDYLILEKTRNCVFVPEEHPIAGRSSISITELKDEPFIVMHSDNMNAGYQYYMGVCRQNGFEPRIAAQGDSISSIEYYLRCKKGVFLSIEAIFDYANEGIVSVPVEELEDNLIYLAWNRNRESRELGKFLEFVGSKVFGRE